MACSAWPQRAGVLPTAVRDIISGIPAVARCINESNLGVCYRIKTVISRQYNSDLFFAIYERESERRCL